MVELADLPGVGEKTSYNHERKTRKNQTNC